MGQEKGVVLLVTNSNPQSQLFIDYVQKQLDCPVTTVDPQEGIENLDAIKGKPAVVLLDADHVDDDTMQSWQARVADHANVALAAFNLSDEDHSADVLATLHLQGVFHRRDDLKLICKGISKMLEGDLWMSRAQMTRLIEFYRRQQLNAYRPVCGLTHRELEIIGLLCSGASNTEIAERLFVSEHTVKSHLYNIFRKINVHNRIQAMNWARQNLMAIPTHIAKSQQKKENPQDP